MHLAKPVRWSGLVMRKRPDGGSPTGHLILWAR